MKIIYTSIGIFFFFLELFFYELTVRLSDFWYAHKAGLGKLGDLCQHADRVGNCLDFNWATVPGVIGLLGIKIIIFVIFLVILFKNKKISSALLVVATYSLLALSFYFDLIPIEKLHNLSQGLDMGMFWGIIFVGILILASSVSSIIYYFYNKNKINDEKV